MFVLALLTLCCAAKLPHAYGVSPRFDPESPYESWPSYSDLPLDPSYPTKAAWGVWGADDVNGALNHITETTIREAASEIQTGQAFNLNLEISFIPTPIIRDRKPTVHLFKPQTAFTDDVVTFNTQASTQFDGLRHYPYSDPVEERSKTYQWYNDLIPTYEDVIGANHTDVLGIQQAAEKGIAARGVLLDYKAWKDSRDETFDPFSTFTVTVADLDSVAEWQGLTGDWAKPGDILLVRFGWVEAFGKLNETQKEALVLGPGAYIGVHADDETAEWFWEKKLAMVGGDNPGFEQTPIEIDTFFNDGKSRSMHEIFIAGWGQSILEFLDLERLAPALHAAGRSTFFVTIQTMNVKGGIASPANAMALI